MVAADKKEAALLAARAGVNLELPEEDCYRYLPELVEEGRLGEERLDELVRPLLYWKIKLGRFEEPYVDPVLAEKVSGSEDHRGNSHQASCRGITPISYED